MPEQQKKKVKGKKESGRERSNGYRFVRDVQILASVNAPKKLLN